MNFYLWEVFEVISGLWIPILKKGRAKVYHALIFWISCLHQKLKCFAQIYGLGYVARILRKCSQICIGSSINSAFLLYAVFLCYFVYIWLWKLETGNACIVVHGNLLSATFLLHGLFFLFISFGLRGLVGCGGVRGITYKFDGWDVISSSMITEFVGFTWGKIVKGSSLLFWDIWWLNSDRNSFWGISNPIFMTYLTDKASAGDSKIILKSSSVKISIVKKPVSDSNSKQTVEGNKQDAQSTGAATSSGLLSLCQQYDSDDDDWFSDPFNLYMSRNIRQNY